jgi:hypothetical protein
MQLRRKIKSGEPLHNVEQNTPQGIHGYCYVDFVDRFCGIGFWNVDLQESSQRTW